MKQLTRQSNKNSPQEYDRIFKERAKSEPNWQDVRRWKMLLKYYEGGSLIDLGCLDSDIPKFIKYPNLYTGVDVVLEALVEMQKKYPHSHYEYSDLYNLPPVIKNFPHSYAILGEVLEHLSEPKKAIREVFKTLKPNGILAISVPLEEAKEPGACDKDRHLWSFTKQDIEDLVKPYAKKIKTKVLRSKWFPKYRYCWPQLLLWAYKK